MKKALIVLLVILILTIPVKRLHKFYTSPAFVKIMMAAQGDCDVPERHRRNITYRIDRFYSKIYRIYIFNVGVNEILEDGTLSLHFLPISYEINDGICKESSIKLFEKLLEFGHDINLKANHSAFNKNTKLTLLHDVILSEDIELIRYLLKKGADPLIKVQMPGKKIDKMNSIELAEFLEKDKSTDLRRQIKDVLINSI